MVFPVFYEARDNHLKPGFMNNQHTKNEKSSMTYEKLMNSHFLKYPTHSAIVHAIFNPFIVAAIILVAVTTYIKIVDGDWTFALMVGFIASMFLSMKMAMVGQMMNGHGVGLRKKGKLSVLGLPSAAVVMYTIILGLLVTITAISFFSKSDVDFGRAQMFGVSMLFGFVMSILSWRLHTYYTTWYGSEYEARMEFKNKGYSDEVIAAKVKKLKEMGILH